MKRMMLTLIMLVSTVTASAQINRFNPIKPIASDTLSVSDSLTVYGPAKINGITALPSTTTISNAFTATGAFTLTNATTTIGRDSSTAAITSGTALGLSTVTTDSLNVGSGDLIVAPTQNEMRYTGKGIIGSGSTINNAQLTVTSSVLQMSLNDASATGSPYFDFSQAGTQRGFLQYSDTDDQIHYSATGGHAFDIYSGTSDVMLIETDGDVLIPVGGLMVGSSSSPSNALDVQWANGKNDTNYLVRLINSDVTSGEDKGVYIQAGSSGGATEVLRVDGSASGRHFTVLGSGFTGVGTVLPTQTFVINDSNARGGGKVAFEEDGTRYGAVGTGAWALGDGSKDITVLADAGHGFKVGTNGSVSFVITSGKDSGFGDTSPNGKVHIVGAGGAASGAAYATNPTLILEDGTQPILQVSPSSTGSFLLNVGNTDSDEGQLSYSLSDSSWTIRAKANNVVKINNRGFSKAQTDSVNKTFTGSSSVFLFKIPTTSAHIVMAFAGEGLTIRASAIVMRADAGVAQVDHIYGAGDLTITASNDSIFATNGNASPFSGKATILRLK